MKVIVAVALFAFVALQVSSAQNTLKNDNSDDEEHPKKIMLFGDPLESAMSHAAPVPDEEKKEEPAASSSPAPSEVTSEVATPAEVKSEAPSSDAPAVRAAAAAAPAAPAAETPAPAEEKKA